MEIRCPYCEKTVQVPGGGQFTCPSCRAVFAVDLEPQQAAAQAPTIAVPPPIPATPGPPPLPGSGPPPLPQPSAPAGPSGPACAKHPTRAAAEVCKRCGNFMCAVCALPYQDGRYCPDCIGLVGGGMGGTSTVPWESERAAIGVFSAYWKTMKTVLFDPDRFFKEMPQAGGLEQPLGYDVLGATVFGFIAQIEIFGIMAIFILAAGGSQAAGAIAGQVPGTVCQTILLPVYAAIGLFISSALYHVVGMILGVKGTFETTFRILGYAGGSVAVLQIVPGLGHLALIVWHIVLVYYGFKNAHRLSSGSALLVALLPLFIGLCCGILIVALFGSVIFAAAGQRGGGF